MRRSIATVCLSGTLEDKLAAAAAAGFDEVELFEPDLIASPWTPAEVRRRGRGARARDRALPAVPRLRGGAGGAAAREPAPRGAQVRGHGASSAPTCCWSARTSPTAAIDDDALAAAQLRDARRARRRARDPHRLRGARLGPPRARLRPRLADRRGRRPPGPRHVPRLVPHPLARRRPARHPRHPGREDLLPAARRRARTS